jgi:hypothetical protein
MKDSCLRLICRLGNQVAKLSGRNGSLEPESLALQDLVGNAQEANNAETEELT